MTGENGGVGGYVSLFNPAQVVAAGLGSGSCGTVWTIGIGGAAGPASLSVDPVNRLAYIVSSGQLYSWNIRNGYEGVIANLPSVDGYAWQNATFMPICGSDTGLM